MDAATFWTAVSAAGAVAAVLIAARALATARQGVVLASKSLDEAKRARKVQLSLELSERYAAPEMHEALAFLGRRWREHGMDATAMVRAYVSDVTHKSASDVAEWDRARRRVSKFFVTAAALCEAGLLEEVVLARQLQRAAFDMCIDIVGPLDEAHSLHVMNRADYDPRAPKYFETFRRSHFG